MHEFHKVTGFDFAGSHALLVRFEDDTQQLIDFKPLLRGELFGPLNDPVVFAGVAIDPDFKTLVWPNGADFDPDTLYHWPDCKEGFVAMASRWSAHP